MLHFKSSEYLFTAVQFCKSIKSYKLCNRFKPLSYTRAREIFLDTLGVLGYNKSQFCLHSLRSGGVSVAAQNNVSDRLLRAHGMWITDKSKDGYIQHDLYNKLLVSRNLDLYPRSLRSPWNIFVIEVVASHSLYAFLFYLKIEKTIFIFV